MLNTKKELTNKNFVSKGVRKECIFKKKTLSCDCVILLYIVLVYRFRDSEIELLVVYESIMKPLALSLDILQGEVDTLYMGSLLPPIVYLIECMEKKKEKLNENHLVIFKPLLDAIIAGIQKRFGDIIENEKAIASSILLPKYKDTWTDDQRQLQKGITF